MSMYLDGLLSVDWDVDALSTVLSGFTPHTVVAVQRCKLCKCLNLDPAPEGGGPNSCISHVCPDPRGDKYMYMYRKKVRQEEIDRGWYGQHNGSELGWHRNRDLWARHAAREQPTPPGGDDS